MILFVWLKTFYLAVLKVRALCDIFVYVVGVNGAGNRLNMVGAFFFLATESSYRDRFLYKWMVLIFIKDANVT